MKKRFLSLILCVTMLFSTEVAGFVALAIDSIPEPPVKPEVWVTLDGELVDDFSVSVHLGLHPLNLGGNVSVLLFENGEPFTVCLPHSSVLWG